MPNFHSSVPAEREKKRVENLLTAGAANQKQLDDWDAQVKLLERQLAAQESSLLNSTNSLTPVCNRFPSSISKFNNLPAASAETITSVASNVPVAS